MTPYYDHAGITIYHGDCREHFSHADLLLTDPPYGLGIAANPFRQRFDRQDWDNHPVDAKLLSSLILLTQSAIIWGGNYFGLPAHQCFLIWDKLQPQDFSSSMCEQAWTNLEMPAKIFRKSVVSYFKEHPTQKPVELLTWCISFLPDAKTILDPFMGSGSTLRAAKDLGRKAIGIEIEERYCEIAAKRMAQEVFSFT